MGQLYVRGLRVGAVEDFLSPGLTPVQAQNAETIYSIFREEGLGHRVALAAIVNAYRESRLGLNNYGDRDSSGVYHSIGLFQLNDRGAGAGLTVSARLSPQVNTRTIIARELKTSRAKNLFDAERAGASIAELAAIFARDIERPRDKPQEMEASRQYAAKLYGAMVAFEGNPDATAARFGGGGEPLVPPSKATPRLSDAPPPSSAGNWLAGLAVVGIVGVTAYSWSKRGRIL